ncbi:uncharacterized protein LOC133520476 isoform X2 [Cydia pomonella]|uniref:uncharacterized protein LOC133520476 isoform X2 n=1 Tax=Cydia pomonella TaxID=82600 RepID=UPI002ADE21F4|nr:uncharacterized protein LOC133520476 isoform X2 [Cydia pomonella]
MRPARLHPTPPLNFSAIKEHVEPYSHYSVTTNIALKSWIRKLHHIPNPTTIPSPLGAASAGCPPPQAAAAAAVTVAVAAPLRNRHPDHNRWQQQRHC